MITVNKDEFQALLEASVNFTEAKNPEFENLTMDLNQDKILVFGQDSQKTRQITSSIDTISDNLHIKTSVQVNAEKLCKILKSFKAETIGLSYGNSALKIASGKACFTLPVSEPMPRELALSSPEFKADELLNCSDLVRALNSVIPFTGNFDMNMDKIRIEKDIDGIVFVSTNSYVLATYYLPLSYAQCKDSFLGSDICIGLDEAKALVKVLETSSKCKIKVTETELRCFTSDSDAVIRLKDNKFPNWASIVRDKADSSMINIKELKEATKALKPVAGFADVSKTLVMDFEDDLLSLESSSDGYIAEFDIKNTTEFTGEFEISLDYLDKILTCCQDYDFVTCDYYTKKEPVIFYVKAVEKDEETNKEKTLFEQEYYIMQLGE